jgi:hypothetical protein
MQNNSDSKSFDLKTYVPKGSIKASESGPNLNMSFKVDSDVPCTARISVCVTEQKDSNNLPIMFYTTDPNKYTKAIELDNPGHG